MRISFGSEAETERSASHPSWMESEINRLTLENVAFRSLMEVMSDVATMTKDPPPDLDILVLLEEVLASALLAVKANDGSLLVVDQESEELAFAVVHGVAHEQLAWQRLSHSTGIAGWVAQHGEPTIVNAPRADRRFAGEVDRLTSYRTDSILAVPVIRDGDVIGVIEALNCHDPEGFDRENQGVLAVTALIVSRLLGVIIDRGAPCPKKPSVRKKTTKKVTAKKVTTKKTKVTAKKSVAKKKVSNTRAVKKKTAAKRAASRTAGCDLPILDADQIVSATETIGLPPAGNET